MKNIAELLAIKEKAVKNISIGKDSPGTRVVVGMATCGIAAGAKPIFAALNDEIKALGLGDITVSQTGCVGLCQYEPLVEIYSGGTVTTYINMDESKAKITAVLFSKINKIYLEGWREMGFLDEQKETDVTQKDKLDVDQILIRNEFSTGLAKYVERLTNAEKELIFMRYYMGYSEKELSTRYGSGAEDIEKKIFLIKQKIAKMIVER